METTRSDSHLDRYAARARGMVASEIRALFAVASRPEIVSLAGGMPFVNALPLDAVGAMLQHLVTSRGAEALQYGSAQGDPELRERICDVMALEGITASPEDVTVTVGSQQALDLLTKIFVDPGDVVLAESPSYVGALGTFAAYQADVVHVPMDAYGLIPEALRETLVRLRAERRRVKFLYTIPTFQNPAGVTLSVRRRAEVLALAEEFDLLIIEDNPYGLLSFDAPPPRPLRADESERVIYLGSFSKTFSSGMRVGWALAPHAVRAKLVLAAESAILSHSNLTQLAVREFLATHPWRDQVKSFVELYRERRDTMLSALEESMPPGTTWTRPGGGFFVWLTLPEGLDSKTMAPLALANRVAYVPGTGFYSDGTGHRHLRISFCYPEPTRIREGITRLATVIHQEQDLRNTFH
ncbi:PLP-dependent aminotransferase family protein [Actinocorallia sp. API 0066]|uniref:aminotransferase-like domain-containing protein n=1 Tax=Actinocorallia sp. API 0066 TaxID=2896846 RepID=UPI001E2C8FDD|nr:PLP-dependent aminotransferase family protein [Actinocorallia sp. API 0066]MCD0452434.1 PLP-dependent aminotransferase family protein [Actinocorallia sp. API 0066]